MFLIMCSWEIVVLFSRNIASRWDAVVNDILVASYSGDAQIKNALRIVPTLIVNISPER
jgi:hypothetical protein